MKITTRRRRYLREAAVALICARLAVRLVTPARLFAWADRPPRRPRRFALDEADWVAWAIEIRGATSRGGAPCLSRALAAHAMLRRRGIASRLCLGVGREAAALTAHAWVEVGGRVIVGRDDGKTFARLAAFGDGPRAAAPAS